MLKRRSQLLVTAILAAVVIYVAPGCKKYYDPPPFFEENPDTLHEASRKMLIIGIDGASGILYKQIKPQVLMELKKHSKFSWEAVSDEVTTDAASWKTLLSGVSYSRHRIKDSNMIYSQPSGAGEHDIIPTYPSFLTYLLTTTRAETRVGVAASWQNILTRLVPEAEDKLLAADDAAVKDSAIALIKKPSSDVIFVQFNSPAKAGLKDGFTSGASGYVDAVNKVDGYIGDLMKALKSRPEYDKEEEWLVVITGTHGGKDHTYGGPSAEETTIPVFYYNEKFVETEFITAGAFSGIEIKGQGDAAVKAKLLNDGGLYNPGRGEQTIQVKVKGTSGSYPHFFSKMDKWPSTPGWSMFTSGSEWSVSVRSTTSGERRLQSNRRAIFDGNWHTLTFTIADSAGKKWARKYTDGIRHDQTDITTIYDDGGSIETASPVTLGWGADPGMGSTTFFTADAMIFDVALSDDEIKSSICMMDISQHPKYKDLIGYWPGNDGYGGRMKNRAPGYDVDFILSGPFQWTKVDDLPCTSVPSTDPTKESLLVKSVDLSTVFFYWLRLEPKANWNLEGTNWLDKYEIEFVDI